MCDYARCNVTCFVAALQLLCQYDAAISQYDNIRFTSVELLLHEDDFHYMARISFPPAFPQVCILKRLILPPFIFLLCHTIYPIYGIHFVRRITFHVHCSPY